MRRNNYYCSVWLLTLNGNSENSFKKMTQWTAFCFFLRRFRRHSRNFFFNFSFKSCVTSFFYRQLFFIVRWKDRKVRKFESRKKVDLIWLKRKTFVFVLRFFNLGKLGSDFDEDTNSLLKTHFCDYWKKLESVFIQQQLADACHSFCHLFSFRVFFKHGYGSHNIISGKTTEFTTVEVWLQ